VRRGEQLFVAQGLQLISKPHKDGHERLIAWSDKVFPRKRAIIGSVTDQLKNISHIKHTRHRSPTNFLVNLVAGLIAYRRLPKKPFLGL
jgi:hypothetical protein